MNRTQTPHEARGKRSARGTSHRIQGRTRRDSGCRLYHRARLSADPTGTGRGRNLLCSFPLGGKNGPQRTTRGAFRGVPEQRFYLRAHLHGGAALRAAEDGAIPQRRSGDRQRGARRGESAARSRLRVTLGD